MTRLQMAGRWTQVIGGVVAWIVFVPLIELVRSAAQRFGRFEDATTVERPPGSRSPVAPVHPRRAA